MYRLLTSAIVTAASFAAPALATTSPAPEAAASAAAPGTLQIALEIHVENGGNPALELATVQTLGVQAAAHGFVLTFSLDEDIIDYLRSSASADEISALTALEDLGHQFGLHADVASMTQNAATLHLATMAGKFSVVFGHVPTTLSGACTASGNWVKAALDNDLTTIAGTVLYCERTLSAAAYIGTEYAAEIAWAQAHCPRPAASGCHDPAPQADEARRVQPWRADSARRWLTESPWATSAVIVPTLGNTSMECASEGASGSCAFDAAGDAAGFVTLATRADELSGDAEGATLHMAWSTNNRPSVAYITDVFEEIAASISAAGPVTWVTLGDVA